LSELTACDGIAIKPRILDSHVESVEKLFLCEANVLIIRRNSGGTRKGTSYLSQVARVIRSPVSTEDASSRFLNASKVGRIKTDSYKPYNGQNDL
jgi:hypothetical protein